MIYALPKIPLVIFLVVFCYCFSDTGVLAADGSELWSRIEKAALKNQNRKGEKYVMDMRVPYNEEKVGSSTEQDAAIVFKRRLWPGAVIPYTFSRTLEFIENAKQTIKGAMFEWEKNTCIRFSPRENEKDYVEFAMNYGCNADVGRRGGRQIVSLGDGCLHTSVVVHEIGHVIGFWHEQNRPDRDEHVKIFTDNIMDQYKEAFAKFNPYRITSLQVAYDYHSIMHYGRKAFTKNGKDTIVPKDETIFTLGNDRLSDLDIKQANLLYQCDTINRGWTMWSSWTACDKSCAGGTQERTRVCTSLKNGEQQCEGGNKIQKRVCNTQECPEWPKFPADFSFERLRADLDKNAECVLVYERADYREWSSYSFCNRGERKIQMRWSDQGSIAGMKCTRIFEPKEAHKNRWYDNYLCLPLAAPYNFTWSPEERKKGQPCIQWYAKEGRDGWDDNFLCLGANNTDTLEPINAPIPGMWGAWKSWSRCTKECGGGKKRRLRLCNNPKPKFGGRYCSGKPYQDKECNTQSCPKCGGELMGTKGQFHSPNYPANYPPHTNCTWIIRGNKNSQIVLQIKSFDFEKFFDEPCKFDYLEVRDKEHNNRLFGKFCGSRIPGPIISESNSLWVTMITDGQDNKAGFRASWEIKEKQPEGCGGLQTGMQGSFNSPNFPAKYPPEKTCSWKIDVPEGYFIQMKFIRFHLEKHSICKYDSVVIKDGWGRKPSLLGRYCGVNPIRESIKTRSNKAEINFVSDHSGEYSGFKLQWKAYKKEISNTLPEVKKNQERDCPEGWVYFAENLEGGACYIVKRNYFNWYAARDDCLGNSADLVSVTTKTEQDFITRDLLQGNYMWLGMTDGDLEGRWAWSDNTTATAFNNWDAGDPNNGGRLQNEDCALIKPDGKWNDYPCEDKFNYICKSKPVELSNYRGASPPKAGADSKLKTSGRRKS
ncbi:bone morphogenetic protein 1-like [Clytia hemisphaerica]|uniref:Metalloendopeptidase n=1 Tax=Clytia hemisphaerica TaxID=252671 RepID=A0A7M5UY33_9CNID|eukprot:TCONS_00053164-protein